MITSRQINNLLENKNKFLVGDTVTLSRSYQKALRWLWIPDPSKPAISTDSLKGEIIKIEPLTVKWNDGTISKYSRESSKDLVKVI